MDPAPNILRDWLTADEVGALCGISRKAVLKKMPTAARRRRGLPYLPARQTNGKRNAQWLIAWATAPKSPAEWQARFKTGRPTGLPT